MFLFLSRVSTTIVAKSIDKGVHILARNPRIFGSFVNNQTNCRYQTSKKTSGNSSKYYYDVLGLKPSATESEIKSAYYKLSKLYHPDTTQGSQDYSRFIEAKEAYEVLGNLEKRRMYDQGIYNPNTFRADSTDTAKDKQTENYKEAVKKRFNSEQRSARRSSYTDESNDSFYNDLHMARRKRHQDLQHQRKMLLLLMLIYGYSVVFLIFIISSGI